MGMVSSCKQTPNMDPPKGLSIAHWKALGESYLLSHKSSSGGGSMKELWPLEYNKYIFYFMVKHCHGTLKVGLLHCATPPPFYPPWPASLSLEILHA